VEVGLPVDGLENPAFVGEVRYQYGDLDGDNSGDGDINSAIFVATSELVSCGDNHWVR
jgi:hypothetical protein